MLMSDVEETDNDAAIEEAMEAALDAADGERLTEVVESLPTQDTLRHVSHLASEERGDRPAADPSGPQQNPRHEFVPVRCDQLSCCRWGRRGARSGPVRLRVLRMAWTFSSSPGALWTRTAHTPTG